MRLLSTSCFALLLAATVALPTITTNTVNNRPIFGILSQPYEDGSQYIAASYVKYIESAGGRVVPLFYNQTTDELDKALAGVNGVLFPGGGASLDKTSQYFQAATHIFNSVVEANKNGQYVPLWATCLGFQTVSVIVSQNHDLLQATDSENITLPLDLTSAASKSRLLAGISADSLKALTTEPITMNNHHWGVTPDDFAASSALTSFFDVLSQNKDREGKVFVSTMEGKNYPIYASQWHPEKNQFEWNPLEVINHSQEAVKTMQYFADFLVDESRRNDRSYTPDELAHRLIYNYPPTFTGGPGHSFDQTYIFPE